LNLILIRGEGKGSVTNEIIPKRAKPGELTEKIAIVISSISFL